MNANGWAGIELRHLLALRAVARSASFSRAAGELGYTQSAVSQQIAMLERIVGLPLFQRPGGRRQVAMSEAGELDLAFVMDSEVVSGGFKTTELLQDPYVLLLPAGSPLADQQPVRLQDLAGLRFVANHMMTCRRFLESALRRFGLEPQVALRSSDNATIQGLVAAGLGVAIVPLLTVDENDPKVIMRRTDP